MAPSRPGALFECIDHQYYTKNNCAKFHEKILNGSQEIKQHKILTNKNG